MWGSGGEPMESDKCSLRRCLCKFQCPRQWNPTLKALVYTVCLTVCIHHTTGEDKGEEVITAVGQTAILSPLNSSSMLSFTWCRGPPTCNTAENILSYLLSNQKEIKGSQYTGRETGQPDGSLMISNVLTNYSGSYTLTMNLMADGSSVTYHKVLKVFEPVSTPVVHEVNPEQITNSSLVLFCSASGTDISYRWYQMDTEVVSGQRIFLSANNQTLMLSPYYKSDTGTIFTCRAFNAVSNDSSVPYTVSMRERNWPRRRKVPVWAIALTVMAITCVIVFIVALIRYCRNKRKAQLAKKEEEEAAAEKMNYSQEEEFKHSVPAGDKSGEDTLKITPKIAPTAMEEATPAPKEKRASISEGFIPALKESEDDIPPPKQKNQNIAEPREDSDSFGEPKKKEVPMPPPKETKQPKSPTQENKESITDSKKRDMPAPREKKGDMPPPKQKKETTSEPKVMKGSVKDPKKREGEMSVPKEKKGDTSQPKEKVGVAPAQKEHKENRPTSKEKEKDKSPPKEKKRDMPMPKEKKDGSQERKGAKPAPKEKK